jgi:hypothetical protein
MEDRGLTVSPDIAATLREYAIANAHASEGVIGDWPTVYDNRGVPCTPQMARYHNAEDAVLALAGRNDLPDAVTAFIEASRDMGCRHCWLSSRAAKQHSECQTKINRWFDARTKIIALGKA